jgi:hypothetical protein
MHSDSKFAMETILGVLAEYPNGINKIKLSEHPHLASFTWDFIQVSLETLRAEGKVSISFKDGALPVWALGEGIQCEVSPDSAEEPRFPATALLCVNDEDLDAWWDSLDVEGKAEAFAAYALDVAITGGRVHVDDLRIPVVGTIGGVDVRVSNGGQVVSATPIADLMQKIQDAANPADGCGVL